MVLKIFLSTNFKGITKILVQSTLEPKDPLGKIGLMLDCIVAIKKMIDILTEILRKQKDMNELVTKLYKIMISTYEEMISWTKFIKGSEHRGTRWPSPKSACMAGTHIHTIDEIERWIEGCNGSTFWCHGMAGTGKSSLMATLHRCLAMQAGKPFQIEEKLGGNKKAAVKGSSLATFI
ncbi:hypothetical protein ARMGADRAFT_1034504 [Armillaria gallica]|uniref:Nephrocystin 3-like N-terminal domain-containing protein n=1 Tax=Armillaria gallica TaxID=47427 RepID=A0A2H3D8Z6_ARMGA|nr:hypothetical protein ARMGADRAFT_1034504 [Armillaria gallica]